MGFKLMKEILWLLLMQILKNFRKARECKKFWRLQNIETEREKGKRKNRKEGWWERESDLRVKRHLSLKLQVWLRRRQNWAGGSGRPTCPSPGSRTCPSLTQFPVTWPQYMASQTGRERHTNPDSYRGIAFPPGHPHITEPTQAKPHPLGGPKEDIVMMTAASLCVSHPVRKRKA